MINEFLQKTLFDFLGNPISMGSVFLMVVIIVGTRLFLKLIKAFIFKTLKSRDWMDTERADMIYNISRLVVILMASLGVIYCLDLDETWSRFLDFKLVSSKMEGGLNISVGSILTFIVILIIARLTIKLIASLLSRALSNNKRLDAGQRFTMVKLVKYFGYVIAFVIAANSAGVNLNALVVGSAALLVGVGLGLQHVFDDLISGFIILFEGTFQVGDVIEFDGIIARVVRIDVRTSKIITRDGNIIVVPNRKLTSENLNNWSHGSDLSRFNINLGVAYGSDVEKVRELLYQCALSHPDVSKNRPISVRFEDFGESSLDFGLYFWAYRSWDVEVLKSDIRFAVNKAFKENDVQIPFPQRDLHIKSGTSSKIF
jgi:small-conductance mechanosensitive channel